MDLILSELHRLDQSTVVVQPEQAIFRTLHPLTISLFYSAPEDYLRELEKSLFKILEINQGVLSTQCVILIGRKLREIYKRNIPFNADQFVSNLNSKPTQSKIILFGALCGTQGLMPTHYQNVMPTLFKVNEKLYIPALYCLRHIFKTLKNTAGKLDSQAISFVNKISSKPIEQSQVACIKLLRVLSVYRNNDVSNIFAIYDNILQSSSSEIINDEIYKSVAKYAATFITPSTSNLDKLQEVFNRYNFYTTFKYFSTIVGPSTISMYSSQLTQLYLSKYPNAVSTIITCVREEDKENIVKSIVNHRDLPDALHCLKILPQTENIILESANVALLLYTSNNSYIKDIGSQFFSSFIFEHREAAFKFIASKLQTIYDQKLKSNDLESTATVISRLIAASPDKYDILNCVKTVFCSILSRDIGETYIWPLLSVCPNEWMNSELVESKINHFEGDYEGIFQFFMFTSTKSSKIKDLILKFVDHCIENITSSIVTSFSVLIPSVFEGTSQIQKIIKTFVEFLFEQEVNQDLVQNITETSFPFEGDIVKKRHHIPEHVYESTKIIIKLSSLICHLISLLTDKEQTSMIDYIINHKKSISMQRVLLIQLINNDKTRDKLPRGFLIPLLKSLKGTDKFFLLLTCESISRYIHFNDSYLKATINFIENNKSNPSNYLIGSLSHHIHISNEYLIRLVMCINKRISSISLRLTSFYALKCIICTHSMDISSLSLGQHQLSLFMDCLNDFTLPEPLLVHLISDTFILLLPTLIPECLEPNSPLRNQITSTVQSLSLTPYLTAREDFYSTVHSVLTYCFPLVSEIDLDSSRSINSASISLRIEVMKAFTILSKQGSCPSTVLSLVIDCCSKMIQQTHENIEFISTVSNAVDYVHQKNELFSIVNLIKSILEEKYIPSLNGVFPCENLIIECLISSSIIFRKLLQIRPLPVIMINDIISSVCLSLLTNNHQIHKYSFDSLSTILELSKRNHQLYDNYEKHFFTAAKIGFTNLDISTKYLTEFVNDKEEVLELYTSEIEKFSTHLPQNIYCIVCRYFINIMKLPKTDKYDHLVKVILPQFLDLMKEMIRYNFNNQDQESYNYFRNYLSVFYEDFSSVISWMTTIDCTQIERNVLLSFYVFELRTSEDIWQINGCIKGITSFVKYSSKIDFDFEILEEGLESILSHLPNIGVSIGQNTSELVSILFEKNIEITTRMKEIIFSLSLNTPCNSHVYIRLLDEHTSHHVELVESFLMSNNIDDEDKTQLFVLYLEKCNHLDITHSAISFCKQQNKVKLGLKLCEISLNYDDISYVSISDFFSSHVRQGVIDILLKLEDSDKLSKLLSNNVANTIFGFCLGDNSNSEKFAQILVKSITCVDNYSFKFSVLRLCCHCLSTWVNDKKTMELYASLFKQTKESLGDKFNEYWQELTPEEREFCIRSLEMI
ncbi:hypothetical protein TVAG_131870 [Trichomonas vaginalis G3]|uniref:Uncharacterized protein n=1 Tax=Trichomonas vaginalis (strain ATCC PRA-98 / G3) TaxID=412133 RepID=A2FMG6_TRIV3|nr:armadillo (ARM) repeat-containing protein family [Trichomonas vaginalis G3]EAX93899.1 hypothetical protein TVAG_131870 [Trichomonas vaginalis G3]KAI5534324.1 armadillo (ARM) repeat-containing protein family [Trichomonas vaginalis G3]|eukprot:XP_001306829.1 hypothetical protein [Trichomonas vaginalis G3]